MLTRKPACQAVLNRLREFGQLAGIIIIKSTCGGAAPALSNLLAGQAAEARGDDGAAQLAYAALLNDPDSRPAAQRALRRLALRHGDDLAAETPTASSTGVPGSTVGGSP